jgi:perosamine synthetase
LINDYNIQFIHFKNTFPHIKIIEDASESHGATHKNIKAGSLGDISVFSFYANKIVTMGEGGIILTDDPIIYNNLLQFRNLNFIDRKKYIHSEAGFNFRLTNIQCALGLGQFKNIDKTIKHRKRVAYAYNKEFKLNPTIQIPFEDKDYNNVYWYYGILINKNYNKILKALEQNNVEYRHFFYPLQTHSRAKR